MLVDRGHWLEAVPDERRAAPLSSIQLVGVHERPAYPDASPAALQRAYRRSEIVFACIEIKARAMTDPRLVVQRRRSVADPFEEDPGHPLRRVLMRPNSRMDEAAFWRMYIASIDIAGRFYAQKLLSAAGGIIGLNPLNPANVKRVEKDGKLTYVWQSGREKREFKPEELLIYEPDEWANPPALAVALGSVDADAAQTDFIRAFFNNAGQPSGVLTTEQELTQEQSDIIAERWRQKYARGGQRQGGIAVLGKGAVYNKTGSNLDELDSESVRGTTESRICMAFGVPPLIVYAYIGLTRATYSNLKEAWRGFWDATLSPMLKQARGWLLWGLLPDFETEDLIYAELVRLGWDLSQVAALQDDVDKTQQRARDNFRAGGITLNEFRAAIGQQEDAAGDYYLRLVSYAPYIAGDQPEVTADDVLAGKRAKFVPAAAKALKADSVETIERRVQKRLSAASKKAWERIAKAIEEEGLE